MQYINFTLIVGIIIYLLLQRFSKQYGIEVVRFNSKPCGVIFFKWKYKLGRYGIDTAERIWSYYWRATN